MTKETKQETAGNEKAAGGKNVAIANYENLPISVKHSVAICNFIRNKKPQDAISLLEKVIKKKIAIPMKGEIPHRKGMSSGRYPVKASKFFIKAIKSVVANASVKGMDIAKIVVVARANKGEKAIHPGWRRRKFKRAHLWIEAREK